MKKSGAFHKTSIGVTKPTTVSGKGTQKLSKLPGDTKKASPPPPAPKSEPPAKQA